MNVQKKKAAIKAHVGLRYAGKTEEEIREALAADAKAYTPDEINEIFQGIMEEPELPQEATEAKESHYITCEEWKMDYSVPNQPPAKARRLRDNVKLSQHVLDNLNEKTCAVNPIQYFPKEA